jgi:DNA (cytosine-5)-methyltransferase 1
VRYLSVCSGIEAASKAWEPLGWKPVAFSEIEPFPAAVLKHHWPEVQNLGDMTKHEQWNIPSGTVDLLVGGTPCQSFSVAGLRQGLKDPRGNLMLTYLGIAERLKPRWLVWENVPGVLSSNGGKDFGSFLGALGELGYEWAYRVLDAQWFGVAQRRRRVFVVAHLGEGNLAAKVLFESESVRRDTAPSREARKGIASNVAPSLTASNDPSRSPQSSEVTQQVNAVLEAVAETLMASDHKGPSHNRDHNFIMQPTPADNPQIFTPSSHAGYKEGIGTLRSNGGDLGGGSENLAVLYENHPNDSRVTGPHDVAPSCVSRYGTGGGNVPLVQEAIPIDLRNANRDPEKHDKMNRQGVGVGKIGDPAHTMTKEFSHGVAVSSGQMAVRRLSPRECERLQGFSDDHTLIPWRNKPADQCPDGPRYKALGNSMAVPCMAWIGKRIARVENERQGAA